MSWKADGWEQLRADLRRCIAACGDPLAAEILEYADRYPDAFERTSSGGAHITVSAVLVSNDGQRTLLTMHPRFERWMQLGGHLELEDTTLIGATVRECVEESGLGDLEVDPVVLSVGSFWPVRCPAGSVSRHYDVRYLVRATGAQAARISDESWALEWWPLDALPEPHDEDLANLATQARERLASQTPG